MINLNKIYKKINIKTGFGYKKYIYNLTKNLKENIINKIWT